MIEITISRIAGIIVHTTQISERIWLPPWMTRLRKPKKALRTPVGTRETGEIGPIGEMGLARMMPTPLCATERDMLLRSFRDVKRKAR